MCRLRVCLCKLQFSQDQAMDAGDSGPDRLIGNGTIGFFQISEASIKWVLDLSEPVKAF